MLANLPELPVVTASPSVGDPVDFEHLEEIVGYLDADQEYPGWRDVVAAIRAVNCGTEEQRHTLAFAWSRGELSTPPKTPARYSDDDAIERVWETMPPRKDGTGVGYGTILHAARIAGYEGDSAVSRPGSVIFANFDGAAFLARANDKGEGPPPGYQPPLSWAQLKVSPYLPPEYVVPDLVLRDHPSLLYGDGGVGKTVLLEHIGVTLAAATVIPDLTLFGLKIIPMPALLVLAEDGFGESKKRIQTICNSLGVNDTDIPLHVRCIQDYKSLDASLAHVSDDGVWTKGPFMDWFRWDLKTIGSCFVGLDTISDIATLTERERLPINVLGKKILSPLCHEFKASMVVTAHPSKAAMNDETWYSGSTGYKSAFRLLATLKRTDGLASKSPGRQWGGLKANYGPDDKMVNLMLIGNTLHNVDEAEIKKLDTDTRTLVLDALFAMIDPPRNRRIVKGNGNGLKVSAVVGEVKDRTGVKLTVKKVREHLEELERAGTINYVSSSNNDKSIKCGWCRPSMNDFSYDDVLAAFMHLGNPVPQSSKVVAGQLVADGKATSVKDAVERLEKNAHGIFKDCVAQGTGASLMWVHPPEDAADASSW
jgi:hypothetical protein